MTQYVTCNNKGLDWLEIALALIDDVDTLALSRYYSGIRIIAKTIESRDTVPTISCASKEEFISLLQQCLGVADDGRMAINVVYTGHSNGIGLNPMPCAAGLTIWERLARIFVNTSDGEVAIYIANIT